MNKEPTPQRGDPETKVTNLSDCKDIPNWSKMTKAQKDLISLSSQNIDLLRKSAELDRQIQLYQQDARIVEELINQQRVIEDVLAQTQGITLEDVKAKQKNQFQQKLTKVKNLVAGGLLSASVGVGGNYLNEEYLRKDHPIFVSADSIIHKGSSFQRKTINSLPTSLQDNYFKTKLLELPEKDLQKTVEYLSDPQNNLGIESPEATAKYLEETVEKSGIKHL
jgi:hypothetical protein